LDVSPLLKMLDEGEGTRDKEGGTFSPFGWFVSILKLSFGSFHDA